MSAAIAVVEALKKTGGDTNTDKLIATMEGMSFETPKGKMTFRKEDHQAMQDMYHFKHQERPGLRLGRARAGARDQGQRNGHPDPQQALMFGACAAAMRRCAVRENLTYWRRSSLCARPAVRPGPDPGALRRSRSRIFGTCRAGCHA
jgi:hypothetical protein